VKVPESPTVTAFVGTSGFAYPQWKGVFYPPGLSSKRMLAHYAERLPSVEINYTFRREPSPATVAAWREAAPETFRFAIKAHMRITHFWPLDPPDDALGSFVTPLEPLQDRVGCVLFQCPPRFTLDADRLRRFLDRLPGWVRPAFEFRHPSWDAARSIVAERGGAWVVTETEDEAAQELPAGGFAYVRLRRTDYDEERLRGWAERLRPALDRGDVFAFFKHEGGDQGPAWAASLLELLR
jgi:uncharacterized protein YecE (DUF72 family)